MAKSTSGTTAYPTRAILLGVEQPHSYAALSAYRAAGVEIAGISDQPVRRLWASRFLRRIHRVHSDEELLRLLDQMAPEGGTLLPFTDEMLLLVSKNHERLSRNFVIAAPPWGVLKPVIDQREAYRTARGIGVNTPAFFVPRDEAEMREIVASLDLENESYLLKTFLEAGPANPELNRYTLLAGTDRERIIANCMAIRERNGEFPMISQVIPGGPEHAYGVVMLVDHEHRPALAYTIKRLKLYKSSHGGRPGAEFTAGANAFCETVNDAEAIETSARLVERFGFTSPIVMEYRRDPRDGRLILVKADPRMTMATGLSRVLGIDLPMQTYRLYNDLPLPPMPAVKPGIRWLWLGGYLDALWTERHYRPIPLEVGRAIRRAHHVRSVGYWEARDPLPFMLDTGAVFAKRALGAFRGRRGRAAG